MGHLYSKYKQTTKEIDQQINARDADATKQVKILILGSLESGKSTIMKQMKILSQNGFTEEERSYYKSVVFSNTIQYMMAIIRAMKDLDIFFENSDHEEDQKLVKQVNSLWEIKDFADIGKSLKALWADSGVKKCYERSREYQLGDSAKYFFDSLDRLCDPSYVPTEEDVLRTRVKTTGILNCKFEYKTVSFNLIDVGGARSERKKWIYAFDNVTSIIFCVGMSEYDLLLAEDEETNRMKESLKLFGAIINNRRFQTIPKILFLNKKDLFEKKIIKTPLSICFQDYSGENEYEPASKFIQEQFEKQIIPSDTGTKEVYTHFVNATDTTNMRLAFDAVFDVILKTT